MALTLNDVREIADYARIALTSEELEEMCAYLNDAVSMLEPICQYDHDGVEPTFHPIGDLSSVMANDEPNVGGRSLTLNDALRNAVSTQGNAFCVPSILGSGEEGQ